MTDYENMNLQKTTSQGASPLFAPVLNRHILSEAKPNLVHQQFGQRVSVPKGQGKSVSWDKLSPLPKAKKPLEEGVTPKGSSIQVTRVNAIPEQYGDYITTTDEFNFYSYDPSPKVLKLNETLANAAAKTLDSLTADAIACGTNVQYAGGKSTRNALTEDDLLTVEEVRKAVRTLKGNNVPKIKGKYVAIVHTDIAHDLMSDPDWRYPHQYVDTKEIYEGEIGELYGVKFVETSEGKTFGGEPFDEYLDTLQIYGVSEDNKTVNIYEDITEEAAEAIVGRNVLIGDRKYTVASAGAGENGSAYITFNEKVTGAEAGVTIFPGEGTASGKKVYATFVLGADAYGVTSLEGNMETFVKPLGSAGSADPLNQRATIGWKAHHLAKILQNLNMVRIESVSSR